MADYDYLILSGLVIPDTQDTLTQVQDEYKAAFGADLNVSPFTPQGILIIAEALARDTVLRNNAALANQINPNLAGGVFLDALLALTGATRNPNVFTSVVCTLTGVPGTNIAAGVLAQDTINALTFQLSDAVTLDGSGNATGTFLATIEGSYTVASNTLTQIITGVLGWETVTNADAGIPGTLTQSDSNARTLRKGTLANQARSLPAAIISGLKETPGVISVGFHENETNNPITYQGVTLSPHSIYVCVAGGTSLDVATTILSRKSGGCDYNGSITVNVTEPSSGQIYPITFDRPTEVPILIRATIRADSSIQDPVTLVKNGILAYASGLVSGEPGFKIGGDVSSFELAGAINIQSPEIYVVKMETTKADVIDYSTDEIEILISEIATIQSSSITVVIV